MQPTVFIHTNHRQFIGALVSAYSLRRNSAHAHKFEVRIIEHKDYPFLQAHEGQPFRRNGGNRVWRNEDLQSFTPLRFMPPALMGYQGRALIIDPDVFAVGDVYELLSRDMQGKAVMCVARPGHNDRQEYLASSVMLLDCAQLSDWHCEKQFNELFAFTRDYAAWIDLALEPRERIGLLEPEWNHFDILNENTKLLHNTKRRTQPWKTGLPKDYTARSKGWRSRVISALTQAQGRLLGSTTAGYYKPHPDPRQEVFFFGLLRECLEQKIVTEELLRKEMRRDHLRHDALALLQRAQVLAAA
jgi:lipopolysaccharide biosynthesis glycosyltransferase